MLGTQRLHVRTRSGKELSALWIWMPKEKRRGKYPSYPSGFVCIFILVDEKPGKMKKKIKRTSLMVLIVFSYHIFHPLLLTLAHAQSLGTISGKVTDAATGEPLGDILVMAVSKEGSEATLETARTYIKDGTYTLTDLPEGAYQVFIDPTANYIRAQQFTDMVVPQGVEIQNVDFTLTKGSSVTGRISLYDSTTKKDVAVMLVAENDTSVVTTGETGNFQAQGLSPDTDYILFASVDEQAFVFTTLTSQTAGLSLSNIDLTLGNPATVLSGVVRTGTTPLADAEVRVASQDTMGYAKTDAQGRYSIKGLKAGSHNVLVTKEGFEDVTQEDVAILDGQQNSADFTISPTQSGTKPHDSETRNLALKKLFGDKVALASIGSINIHAFAPASVLIEIVPVALLAAALTLLTLIGARIINVRQIWDACKTIAYSISYTLKRPDIERCHFDGITTFSNYNRLPERPGTRYLCYYNCICYWHGIIPIRKGPFSKDAYKTGIGGDEVVQACQPYDFAFTPCR